MPLTIPEVKTAASFLRQARVLVESVKYFFRGYETDATGRLGLLRSWPDSGTGLSAGWIGASPERCCWVRCRVSSPRATSRRGSPIACCCPFWPVF
jgi:hypothetical protein